MMVDNEKRPATEPQGDIWKTQSGLLQSKDSNNQRDLQTLPMVFRVGAGIYEKSKKLVDGLVEDCFVKVDRSYIADVYGKDMLSQLTRFDAFACVPGHGENFHEIINIGGCRFVNTYAPLPQSLAESDGETPHFDLLMKRVFAEQINLGMQYLAYLLQKPEQILPILCLISLSNHSGKSTFFILLKLLFGRNAWLLGEQDLQSNFTPFFKGLLAMFEEISNGRKSMNKIKALGTAKTLTVNEKFASQYSTDAHLKILISSNDTKSFLKVGSEDIRFWVRELQPMTQEEFIPDFESKLKAEVPFILRKLSQVKLMEPLSRMVFSREQIQTQALANLVENSKSDCAKDVEAWISEQADSHDSEFFATATEIARELRKPYNLFQVRNALQQELDYPAPSVKRRYTNFAGISAQGCPYTFVPNASKVGGKENCDDGNIPTESDDLPF